MKLLLVIVSIIAVFTADCRNLAGEPEDQDSQDNNLNYTDELLGHDYFEEEPQLKEEKENKKRELRRSGCKARNACVVMGGFCVTNATHCNGRVVPEGCKGVNCQCCVPGTLELKMESYENELQSLKINLTGNDMELKMEMQALNSNNSEANSNLKMELHSLRSNITHGNSDIASALKNINDHLECPDGFLLSSQCFRLYKDVTRTWTSARSKCQSAGLRLAEPADSVAVALREYVLHNYGDNTQAWVGAKGDGSKHVWEKNGTYLYKESTLLDDGYGSSSSMSTSHCLELDVLQSQYTHYYSKPYDIVSCSTSHWTLCEVVKGVVY